MLEYLKCKNDFILLYGFDAVLWRRVSKSVTVGNREEDSLGFCVWNIESLYVYLPKLRHQRQLRSVQQPVYSCRYVRVCMLSLNREHNQAQ